MRFLIQAWRCFKGQHLLVQEVVTVSLLRLHGVHGPDRIVWRQTERTYCEACQWDAEVDNG